MLRISNKSGIILILTAITISTVGGFWAGYKTGESNYIEKAGRVITIDNKNTKLVEELFVKKLDYAYNLNDGESGKLYDYKIESITPKVILNKEGSKVVYLIIYSVKITKGSDKIDTSTGNSWVAGNGIVILDNGWVKNKSTNVVLEESNGEMELTPYFYE